MCTAKSSSIAMGSCIERCASSSRHCRGSSAAHTQPCASAAAAAPLPHAPPATRAANMAAELPPHHELQAVAFHMYHKCADQSEAFNSCVKSSNRPSKECQEQYAALASCTKELINEAVAKAKEEWHHYTHCLELVGGKYSHCRPEKAKFEEAFPLEA